MSNALMKKRKMFALKRNDIFWFIVMVSPIVAGMVLFMIVPLFWCIYLSFTDYNMFTIPVGNDFANYIRLFTLETEFWKSLINAAIATISVPICMAIAMVFANILAGKIKGKKFFKMVFFLPTICSAVAITFIWKWLFNTNWGLFNTVLGVFGIGPVNFLSEALAMPSMILMGVWGGIGISLLMYVAAISNLPRSYYEAAKMDGAGGVTIFFKITVPLISPTSFYLLVTGLISSLQDFSRFFVMTDGNPDTTLMPVMVVYRYAGHAYGNMFGYACSMAIMLGIIIGVVTAINFAVSRKWVYYES
ncbi:MAG: carbohydrate ABC transporter permease [Christensenellales bacterium]